MAVTVRGTRGETLEEFARRQTADLLRRMSFQANRACRLKDEGSVHDLRVAIRRLQRCVRLFEQFLPEPRSKKLRSALGRLLDLASEVRNRDIAIGILRRSKMPGTSRLERALEAERRAAERKLLAELESWARKNQQRKWRARLRL